MRSSSIEGGGGTTGSFDPEKPPPSPELHVSPEQTVELLQRQAQPLTS